MKTVLTTLWIFVYLVEVGMLVFNPAIVPTSKGTDDHSVNVDQSTAPAKGRNY